MKLREKTVVITGATGGIGQEICKKFSEKGAKLVMIARTQGKLKELKASLSGDEHIYFVLTLQKC